MRQTESERRAVDADADANADADDTVARLRAALADEGIVLPSLRVDPVTAVRGPALALVDLGSCNLRTAERLVAVLRARAAGEGRT